MAEPVAELELSDYLDIARRRKWVIATVVALTLGAAILASALQTPQYRAQARVRVESASTNGGILDDTTNLSSNVRDRNLQNEVEFAKSDRVRDRASSEFGEIIQASVAPAGGSDTLTFSSVDQDPDRAANVANTFAGAYVSERSVASGERFLSAVTVINDRLAEISAERLELERQLESSSDASSVNIQIATLDAEEARLRAQLNEIDVLGQINQSASVAILNQAEAPSSPFAPSWIRNIALALVAGLVVGVGAALLRETLDDTIINKRDLELATDGTPVLGVIPRPWTGRGRARRDRRLIATRTGAFTEAFRSLRSAIELGQASGSEIRSILVTSANPAEGKSTVVSHLALSFARAGANVLVIDADMHNPTQHELFGVHNVNGMAEHLANIGEAEIVTEQGSGESLVSVIPAGTSASPPAELLSSMAAHEFIQKLSYAYDLVIVDAPPLRPVADTLPVARIVDATLMVAMRGQTNGKELAQAMELLARAQSRPLGAVLNGADEADGGYGYGYGYGYGAKKR